MLDTHVLVLNRSWVAVNVTPVRRALCLLYTGDAQVVHPEDYSLYDFDTWCMLSTHAPPANGHRCVHTTHLAIRLPEVIILRAFNGFIRREVPFTRRNIFARDRHQCQYCARLFSKQELTLDHVMPRSRGGKDTWDNLVLACKACNVRKGNRTPDEANMPLLRRPEAPRWLPRFGTHVPRAELASWARFLDNGYKVAVGE